jgi:regulatory protein YycI of two-component signal transduction system YycFG
MKDLIIILLLLTLTLTLHHQHSDPVKVLLYPYLPSTGNKTAEYQNLVELLNKKLKDSNINVHVTLNKKECDFYNLTSLAGCFDKYDVI